MSLIKQMKKIKKTRVEHRCTCCRRIIPIGESSYEWPLTPMNALDWEGYFDHWYFHEHCVKATEDIADYYGEYTEEGFSEAWDTLSYNMQEGWSDWADTILELQ